MSGNLDLTLDTITFDPELLEVPETIHSVGGYQVIESHDFPGGLRTHQVFGWFAPPIEWHGILTGSGALDRRAEIAQLASTGNEVQLSYGDKAWLGRVSVFEPKPKTQWFIPYRIVFLPRIDLTGQQGDTGPPPEAQLADQMNILGDATAGIPFALPDILAAPVQGLMDTVNGAMSAAGGLISNVTGAAQVAIGTAVGSVANLAAPLFDAADAATSFMASTVDSAAGIVGGLMAAAPLPAFLIRSVNPNLTLLAAQYLGSADQWPAIAAFNNMDPPDPQPTGSFNLSIPPKLQLNSAAGGVRV